MRIAVQGGQGGRVYGIDLAHDGIGGLGGMDEWDLPGHMHDQALDGFPPPQKPGAPYQMMVAKSPAQGAVDENQGRRLAVSGHAPSLCTRAVV
jgi:hypothetical protein